MIVAWKSFRRGLFALSAEQTSFIRRGFRGGTPCIHRRLETVGAAFVAGYNLAVEHAAPELFGPDRISIEPELLGFAFEGAGMGFALLDYLTPWRCNRINEFLHGAGDSHAYMVHVGVGWVWARLPINFRRAQTRLNPAFGWLAFDGWGFHEGFFHWHKYINGEPAPKKLVGYERRAFDQGLGRSFWFVNSGNIELIEQTLSNFSADRQSDLWSGVGLAATYAGIVNESELQNLRELAGHFRPQLAQGAAFAAKARARAGNLTEYTDLAAGILCDTTAEDAARVTDAALENLPADGEQPAYEIWRRRVQNHFVPYY